MIVRPGYPPIPHAGHSVHTYGPVLGAQAYGNDPL